MREPKVDWFWVGLAIGSMILGLVELYQHDLEEMLDNFFAAVLITMYVYTKYELDELRYWVWRSR